MPKNVKVEWRQGEDGLGTVYKFNPTPSITRVQQGLKQAQFNIPLRDGSFIQNLGEETREIVLTGTIYAKTQIFEDLEDKRKALILGIGKTAGQLHIVSLTNMSNPKHIYYKGQISPQGIVFQDQTNPVFLDYTIRIICAEPYEIEAGTTPTVTQTITSNAEIS